MSKHAKSTLKLPLFLNHHFLKFHPIQKQGYIAQNECSLWWLTLIIVLTMNQQKSEKRGFWTWHVMILPRWFMESFFSWKLKEDTRTKISNFHLPTTVSTYSKASKPTTKDPFCKLLQKSKQNIFKIIYWVFLKGKNCFYLNGS